MILDCVTNIIRYPVKKTNRTLNTVPQHRSSSTAGTYIKIYMSFILPVMVSTSRVLTGMTSLLFGDRNAWRVALAVGETFREAADGRMGPSGRFGPTSSTVASLDAVATSDIASLS